MRHGGLYGYTGLEMKWQLLQHSGPGVLEFVGAIQGYVGVMWGYMGFL